MFIRFFKKKYKGEGITDDKYFVIIWYGKIAEK